MKVKIQDTRISFPHLFEPKAVGEKGNPRFSAAFVIDPAAKPLVEIDGNWVAATWPSIIKRVAVDKWKDKADAILKELKAKGRLCYKDSPLTNSEGEVYDGFEGMHCLNASNEARPIVLDRDRTPLTQADGRPYGGCYVYASVDVWAQDNQYGKRINATLKGVQFYRDGDAFGGGAPASPDDFDDLGVPDESADDDLAKLA